MVSMLELASKLLREPTLQKISEIEFDFMPLAKFTLINLILAILANFPAITLPFPKNDPIVIYLVPYVLQIMLKYVLSLMIFITVFIGVLYFHIWLIVKIVSWATIVGKLAGAADTWLKSIAGT